jgi:hypothetical protein
VEQNGCSGFARYLNSAIEGAGIDHNNLIDKL